MPNYSERQIPDWLQVVITCAIGLAGVVVLVNIADIVDPLIAAVALCMPGVFLTLFGGGYLFGKWLNLRNVWIALIFVGVLIFTASGHSIIHHSLSRLLMDLLMIIVIVVTGTHIISSGVSFRRTRKWLHFTLGVLYSTAGVAVFYFLFWH